MDGDYNVNGYKMLRHLLDYDSSLIQRTVKNELDAIALEEDLEGLGRTSFVRFHSSAT